MRTCQVFTVISFRDTIEYESNSAVRAELVL